MNDSIINYNEASDFRNRIKDQTTRDLVSLVFSVLDRKLIAGQRPTGQFDVLFFCSILEEAMSPHDRLRSILDGESELWPEAMMSP